jgi:hypothetical protein
MLSDRLIVEARTMARCVYENLFRVGYLVSKNYAAIKTWLSEDDASNKAVGNDLLEWTKSHALEEIEEFAQFMDDLNKKVIVRSGMQAQAIAAGLNEHYITYRMLSADSAHPTARVLSRHARTEADGSLTISGASLWTDEDEEIDTWSLGCSAFLSILFCVNGILGLGYREALERCDAECSELDAKTAAGLG